MITKLATATLCRRKRAATVFGLFRSVSSISSGLLSGKGVLAMRRRAQPAGLRAYSRWVVKGEDAVTLSLPSLQFLTVERPAFQVRPPVPLRRQRVGQVGQASYNALICNLRNVHTTIEHPDIVAYIQRRVRRVVVKRPLQLEVDSPARALPGRSADPASITFSSKSPPIASE